MNDFLDLSTDLYSQNMNMNTLPSTNQMYFPGYKNNNPNNFKKMHFGGGINTAEDNDMNTEKNQTTCNTLPESDYHTTARNSFHSIYENEQLIRNLEIELSVSKMKKERTLSQLEQSIINI
jgi:hypothetical protein